jgi:formate hydrogenlyase transcriptional activator
MASSGHESETKQVLEAQLRATLDVIPAYTWYTNPSGALTFVNRRCADYLGLPEDHPLRLGIDIDAAWDSHIPLLHPDDHEETRRVWSTCLRTGCAGEVSFRVRNAEGLYRWFLSRAEPLRRSDGTLLYWIGINIDIEERKRAELFLAEGQRLAHTGSWAFNSAGFEYWSPELFQIHGLDPKGNAPTKEEYLALAHPEDREFVEQEIRKMLTTHRGFDFTKRIVRPDGNIRRLRCVGAPAAEGGSFQGFVGTCVDVTEQEHLTQELQRREAYLAEGQRLSHTGSFGWRVSSGEIFWSDETFRIFQCDPGATPALAFDITRVHSEDRDRVQQQIDRASRDGKAFNFENRLQMPDGTIKHVRVTARPFSDSLGDLEFVGAVTDISSEESFRLIVETIPGLIAVMTTEGDVAHVNRRVLDYFGRTLEELKEWGTTDAVHPADLPGVVVAWQHAVETGLPYEVEHRLRRADGEYRWFVSRGLPLRDAGGHIVRWYNLLTDIHVRKQSEESLQRSEAALQKAFDEIKKSEADLLEAQRLSHTGSWRHDVLTGIVTFSPEVHRIFDIRSDEDASTAGFFFGRIHPEDRPIEAQNYERANLSKTDFESDYRIVLPDGSIKHVHNVGHPVLNESGDIRGFVGTAIDITERKRAEAKIRQVVDAIPTLAWCNLPDGPNEFLNKRWHDYTGLSPEESHGWGWQVAFHPEDLPPLMKKWQELLISGEPGEIEARIRRFDGAYRWFLISVEPFRDEAGRIVRWYGTSTDIEDRKQAEDSLRQENIALMRAEEEIRGQEAELHQMVEFTPQLVAVFGPKRERLFVNRNALDYLGISLDEWRQRGVGAEVHPDDSERLKTYADRALSNGASYELEVRLRKADGSYRWFLARYNPVHDNKGQAVRWYVACTDIEDRKQAEERLQRENVALREEIAKASMFEEIVGASPALQAVLSRVSKVAPSDSSVLITGETGTGKELVARAIHRRSNRTSRAFVSVNCAAIPRDLIASELFGHEKGAYTGATHQRLGRFELANGGTIFLDEVGELPAETQVALLRVLQEREFERVGGTRRIRADVRVIAATNRDLRAAIRTGAFRSDLFYRLPLLSKLAENWSPTSPE